MRRSPLVAALVCGAAVLPAACGGSSGATGTSTGASSVAASGGAALSGDLIVLAATPLTGSFQAIGKQFEAAHPGTTVTFRFGASAALAALIEQGAPVDVFASATPKAMDALVAAKTAGSATPFAGNSLQIAVPAGNPAHVTGLADLAKAGVEVAVCQVQAPCGAAAATLFKNAKLTVKPAAQGADAASTLAKVAGGEVDAGVVYVSDVVGAGKAVEGIAIPADLNVETTYPIAVLVDSTNPALAQAFVDEVHAPEAQKILKNAGFTAP